MKNSNNESNASKKFWEDITILFVIIGLALFIISKFIPFHKAKPIESMPQVKSETNATTEINTPTIKSTTEAYIPPAATGIAPADQSDTKSASLNEFSKDYKQSISWLDEAITLSIALDDKDASNCPGCDSNKQALADYLTKRFHVYDKSSDSYRQMYQALAGDSSLNNPHFLTQSGILYIVEKAQGKCGDINTTDPNQANCVIIVDINGQKPPNQLSTGNKLNKNYRVKDRLRLVVLKQTVAPAANQENDVAEYVLYY